MDKKLYWSDDNGQVSCEEHLYRWGGFIGGDVHNHNKMNWEEVPAELRHEITECELCRYDEIKEIEKLYNG